MNGYGKIRIFTALILSILLLSSCGTTAPSPETETTRIIGNAETLYPEAHILRLDGHTATLDGEAVSVCDYTWHCDPAVSHDEVKNAPAEYHTGDKPDTDDIVYIDSDLYYYPSLPESGFKKVTYDGETEWAYYYTDGEHDDYIFATLPNLGTSLPTDMMHTESEAAENKVLHITAAGEYILEGEWNGQIWIDLGDKDATFTDETAVVTLILNGVDITCTVAPGIVFYSLFECDNAWEETETHTAVVNTENAGAKLVIAENSENTVSGKNVFRMLKTKYKDEDSKQTINVQKKMRKTDAALYSYVTMNVSGGGHLTVNSGFEGMDSELHLTMNSGNITINSQDDGVNVNEDNVSVMTINGGSLEINAAQGAEGDGIDSNGFVVINGGTVSVNGVVAPDSAIDSEDGITYNGGEIIIDGVTQSFELGSTFRETGGMGDFGGPMGERPEMPDSGRPDMPQMPDGERPPLPPDMGDRPEGFDPNNKPN